MIKVKNVFRCILAMSILSFHSSMIPGVAAAVPAMAFRRILSGFFTYLFYSSPYANHGVVQYGAVQQEPYAPYTLAIHVLEQPHIYDILHDASPDDRYLVTPCDERYNVIGGGNLCINTLSVITKRMCEGDDEACLDVYSINKIPDRSLIPSDKLLKKELRAEHIRAFLKSHMPADARVYIKYDTPTYVFASAHVEVDTLLRRFTRTLFNYTKGSIITYNSHDKGYSDHYLFPYKSRIIIDGGISPIDLLLYMKKSLLALPYREPSDYLALRNIKKLKNELRSNSTGRILTFDSKDPHMYEPFFMQYVRDLIQIFQSFSRRFPLPQYVKIGDSSKQARIFNNEVNNSIAYLSS